MRKFIYCFITAIWFAGSSFAQTNTVLGTINGSSFTDDELQREMLKHRATVLRLLRTSNLSEQKLLTAIKKAALDSLTIIKVQENLLKERSLWQYANYKAVLNDLETTNQARKQMAAKGQFFVGPAQFTQEGFYGYQFSNSLIELKRLLVDEAKIKVTDDDLQAQFKVMQRTMYKEPKYLLKDYTRQVKDAFIEVAYHQYIAGLVKLAKVTVDDKKLAAISTLQWQVNNSTAKGTVFVDAVLGNDNNDGKTAKTAWKSIEKLNNTTFKPGDRILLKAGGVWVGALHPKGSGVKGKPIILSSYGKGPRPLIDGNGMVGKGVFSLHNQQYWEVSDLELVNDAATPGDRRGVEVKASNAGVLEHIYLKNLEIHHIKGIVGNGHPEKRTSGIYITTEKDKLKPTRYHDILIEDCNIHHIENQGIATSHETAVFDYPGTGEWENRKLTGLIIRNNVITYISKNAMIIRMTEGGVVEHNLCYETALVITGNTIFSRTLIGTVFQFNEGFLNRSPDADGSLYDPDINSPGTIWQYSYSHDNAHGLVWFCTEKRDDNIIVRYNLSRNDKGNLVYFNYAFKQASVYNNVFYIPKHLAPVIIREKGTNPHSYSFYNNIIYNLSDKASYMLANNPVAPQERSYANNLFFGVHPTGEPTGHGKLTDDPIFTDVDIKEHLKKPWGFQLKNNSPALKAGKPIADNGGKDFFGKEVNNSKPIAIGFDNGK